MKLFTIFNVHDTAYCTSKKEILYSITLSYTFVLVILVSSNLIHAHFIYRRLYFQSGVQFQPSDSCAWLRDSIHCLRLSCDTTATNFESERPWKEAVVTYLRYYKVTFVFELRESI